MRAETINLFALISIRALADYDAPEFRRATDLSKGELDERIRILFDQISGDEPLVSMAREQLQALRSAELEAQSQTELLFLLRAMSHSSLERAQQLALRYSREQNKAAAKLLRIPNRSLAGDVGGVGQELEYLRLGVMRLLRDLPGYIPRFDYRLKNIRIDCFLEPNTDGRPILVEAKMLIGSRAEAQKKVHNLKTATASLGSNTLSVLLAAGGAGEVYELPQWPDKKFFLLSYDPESNEFSADQLDAFIRAVNERARRSAR